MNKNKQKQAALVQEMLMEYYEPGRQDRCKLWVFRHIIQKRYPMSESTFFRLLKINVEEEKKKSHSK